MVLSEVTKDIRSNYLQRVFSDASLPDAEVVQEQLFFLAMYVIDGAIKNSTEKSWIGKPRVHCQAVLLQVR